MIDDAHTPRRLKVIQSTSSSQVSAFAETCNRYWFFQTIEGLRDKEDEKPAHLMRGSHIDSRVERILGGAPLASESVTVTLNDGAPRTEDWTELVKAVLVHLPDPTKHKLTLQHWGRVPVYVGGPICVVKPDVMHCPTPRTLRIDDLKTTSDFKYCKSAAELAQNIQLNTYSRYGYEELKADAVSIGHAYARTKWDYKGNRPAPARAHRSLKPHGQDKGLRGDEPCECPECKAWLSDANRGKPLPDGTLNLTREGVNAFWQSRIVPQVKLMVEAASTVKDAQELPPSTEKCSKIYGQPCPYRERCGFSNPETGFYNFGGITNMETMKTGMTLTERLAAARAAQAPNGSVTSPENKVQPVLPTQQSRVEPAVDIAKVVNEGKPNGGQMVSTEGNGGRIVGGGGPPVDTEERCVACNAVLTIQNISHLPSGKVVHIGCAAGAVQKFVEVGGVTVTEGAGMHVLPPEVRNLRESTPEQVAAVETQKRGRGRPKKQAAVTVNVECVFCQGLFPVDKIDTHQEMMHPVETQKRKDEEAAKRRAEEEVLEAQRQDAQEAARHDAAMRRRGEAPENLKIEAAFDDAAKVEMGKAEHGNGAVTKQMQKPIVMLPVPDVEIKGLLKVPGIPPLLEQQVASDRRDAAQAHVNSTLASARTVERKVPPEAPTVYVDCYPRKGAPATMGDEWLAPIMELAALANTDRDGKSAPMEDFRLIPYTADGVLAVAIRACLDSTPARLCLSSENRAHRVALEVLTPFAREIVG